MSFGSFNLELRPVRTEAVFSLIVKRIRCFGKTKTHRGALYLKENKYIYWKRRFTY